MNTQISSLMFFIGLIIGSLNIFLTHVITDLNTVFLLDGLLTFIGLFLVGWALLSFAVNKQMLLNQKMVAIFFATLILVALLGAYVKVELGVSYV